MGKVDAVLHVNAKVALQLDEILGKPDAAFHDVRIAQHIQQLSWWYAVTHVLTMD